MKSLEGMKKRRNFISLKLKLKLETLIFIGTTLTDLFAFKTSVK
jgi:hypothetical protein